MFLTPTATRAYGIRREDDMPLSERVCACISRFQRGLASSNPQDEGGVLREDDHWFLAGFREN